VKDQSVRIGGLTLKNAVLTASGCFGYGLEYDDFYDVSTLGGICTKGLSLHPRLGNAPERICETAAGMLNAIGLELAGRPRAVVACLSTQTFIDELIAAIDGERVDWWRARYRRVTALLLDDVHLLSGKEQFAGPV